MLPLPHRRWAFDALRREAPEQPRSTCHACPVSGPGRPFRAEVKCCGFTPELPNFQVGELLHVASVQRRIAEGQARPLGLGRSLAYEARARDAEFGRDVGLACPHLVDGGCSVWERREAICATWFCRIDGGEAGQQLQEELRRTLRHLEGLTARAAMEGLDWQGLGPRAFYAACSERARGITWSDLREMGGFELRHRLRELRRVDRALRG